MPAPFLPPAAAARGAEAEQATQQAVTSAVRPLEAEIASLRARLREARAGAAAREAALHEQGCLRLQRFVDMLYIAATLDPFAMQHEAAHYERQICLGYAQQAEVPLSVAELTDLAAFARLVTSRCFHSHLSHAVRHIDGQREGGRYIFVCVWGVGGC